MPKPVLSDSLFNADDVATALVNNYNLAVSNQDFAVTEISSNFSLETGWDSLYVKAFAFNGFVFINLECRHVGASPGTMNILQRIVIQTIFLQFYLPAQVQDGVVIHQTKLNLIPMVN